MPMTSAMIRGAEAALPPSPPSETAAAPDEVQAVVATAAKVLEAQAGALTDIRELFDDDDSAGVARMFYDSVALMRSAVLRGHKIVISGMGKSYKIAGKLVATLQSFGIPAAALHPSDALHGDIGNVQAEDVLVMITASGNTPELRVLKQYLPAGLPIVVLTNSVASPLASQAHGVIAAPVADHHAETNVYGLAAPTVTTTACLAVGDAMCIALNEMLVQDHKRRHANFTRWHPGGAIGHANSDDELIPLDVVPQLTKALVECEEVELWRASASCRFVVCHNIVYQSRDIVDALRVGGRSVPGSSLASAPRVSLYQAHRRQGLSVVVDVAGEPQGLVWRE